MCVCVGVRGREYVYKCVGGIEGREGGKEGYEVEWCV